MSVGTFRSTFPFAAIISAIIFLVGCNVPINLQPEPALARPALKALQDPVQVLRADSQATALVKDQSIPLEINDTMTADEPGRGLFQLDDRVAVDLFRGSSFRLTGMRSEANGAVLVELEQLKGHIRVLAREDARVRLVTSIATITTLRPETDFVICHNPAALSCIVALSGEVEVVGQGKVVTIKGGEATYVLKDQQPFDAICARPQEIDTWIGQKIGTADEIPPISKLVAGWNPEPCPAATQRAEQAAAATNAAPVLPSAAGMVKIPAGTYVVGAADPYENQAAAQEVNLAEFWIDQYEVAGGQYQAFLNETGYTSPQGGISDAALPVSGVTWNDAEAYCTWARKRLPSEAEWEAAARGPGPNPPSYPWGGDSQAGGKVYDLPLDRPYPPGEFAFNRSALGVFDMAGNVWEWVGEPYAATAEYSKVLRGGRYGLLKDMAYREQTSPDNARFVPYAGFRCAANQVEGD